MPVLLILLLLCPTLLFAQPPDLFSFAASLAAEADHYRAITEYKRFLHYQPQDPRAPQAQLAIARSLMVGQRWQSSDRALEKVWQNYPNSPAARQAHQLYADSAFTREDYPTARERYQQLKKSALQANSRNDFHIGLSYLEEGRLKEAELSVTQLPEKDAEELHTALASYHQLPRKSPQLAGTLSAILPGSGQLYTERPQQAAVAFALNAAFIYGAIEAWNNENYAVAGILSLFEIGWYGGNIL